MHQHRASPFASDLALQMRYARNFCSGDHLNQKSQIESPFASNFRSQGIAHLGASKNLAMFRGAVKSRPEAQRLRDFGTLTHSRWDVLVE